jgi:hypothetical protein
MMINIFLQFFVKFAYNYNFNHLMHNYTKHWEIQFDFFIIKILIIFQVIKSLIHLINSPN